MKFRNVLLQVLILAIAVMIGSALPLDAQTGANQVVVVDGERVTAETQIGADDHPAGECAG
ncbi:MAG: hypothetical protein GWN51_17695 [Gemmatimonadetes bacterium]|nr:hypothetical protein [Gemmatimonadota bacterium]NIV25465.1 hypothetical protein [Gemmatimonadota bacterium]NIY37397.1 hypothetical protein [Gemmatimonadota bacterium]